MSSGRSGKYITQSTGYKSFLPEALPPKPQIRYFPELQLALSKADQAIGRLDAATELLPNPDLFVTMYVRKEAALSSQIEGTQASLADVLEFEASKGRKHRTGDEKEILNYINALNYGLNKLQEIPLSLRLLKEIHSRLMVGVRGANRNPGEFRKTQNWIGSSGATIETAAFVPPPPHEVPRLMGDLEMFLNSDHQIPYLVQCGLAHAQLETIHPFLDGNGRMGRLLITFLLCQRGVLNKPLLYLSHYFKSNREEYYKKLQSTRDEGDWEGWLLFFLKGVDSVARQAAKTAREIQDLRESHREIVGTNSGLSLKFLDAMFESPLFTLGDISKQIGCTYQGASNIVKKMQAKGLVRKIIYGSNRKLFSYQPYLDLFNN